MGALKIYNSLYYSIRKFAVVGDLLDQKMLAMMKIVIILVNPYMPASIAFKHLFMLYIFLFS